MRSSASWAGLIFRVYDQSEYKFNLITAGDEINSIENFQSSLNKSLIKFVVSHKKYRGQFYYSENCMEGREFNG